MYQSFVIIANPKVLSVGLMMIDSLEVRVPRAFLRGPCRQNWKDEGIVRVIWKETKFLTSCKIWLKGYGTWGGFQEGFGIKNFRMWHVAKWNNMTNERKKFTNFLKISRGPNIWSCWRLEMSLKKEDEEGKWHEWSVGVMKRVWGRIHKENNAKICKKDMKEMRCSQVEFRMMNKKN